MKLEELIKKVKQLNKLNKELNINKQYVVRLDNRFKSFEFIDTDFKELENYWIEKVSDQLKNRIFQRMDINDSWYLEINTESERLYFDLFIKED